MIGRDFGLGFWVGILGWDGLADLGNGTGSRQSPCHWLPPLMLLLGHIVRTLRGTNRSQC